MILRSLFALILFYTPLLYAHDMPMHGMYGSYSMNREASGTSWQPDSTPMEGLMFMSNDWMVMLHGYANGIYDHQGGPRGGTETFSTSMFMFMAQKDIGPGTFGFRSMVSLDPLMGKSGYPLLLQTGETANGRTPLIDRQHPHDFFMELAGTYSIPLTTTRSIFIYLGLPGEPALGPPAFMHRFSGIDIPEAPITHHWLDSTHITYGVATLGYVWCNFKLEASAFKGREPDQFRWNIESPKLDSHSFRLSYNPNENWSLQVSYGHIVSPEQLDPNVNTNRTTASVIYNKPFGENNNWQTTLAWGQNNHHPGHTLNGYMLESAVNIKKTHTIFGRFERVDEDELLQENHQVFTVNKLSLGYIYDFPIWKSLQPGIGALISTYDLPAALRTVYGNRPFSYMLFGRIKLA